MGYIQDIGRDVDDFILKIVKSERPEALDKHAGGLIQFVKDKILESYKNGIKVGESKRRKSVKPR